MTMLQKEPKVAHNLTEKQLSDLHLAQTAGEQKMTTGNKDGGYEMPVAEKHLVHAKIYVPQFDPATGADLSSKNIQKFYPKEFERMEKEQAFAGMKVEILHEAEDHVEDISEADVLTPKIVSVGAGAGQKLTVPLDQQKVGELRKFYKELYPDEDESKKTKDEAIAGITEKIAFLQNEAKVEEYAQIELNRLTAAGYIV